MPISRSEPPTFARILAIGAALALVLLVDGCVSIAPAPGAEKLRVTSNPADLSGCTAVGNIQVVDNVPPAATETEFRNQAIGLGANAALATVSILGVPFEGVAYRCPP